MKHKFFGSSIIILMVITLLLVAVSPVAASPAETVRVWVSYQNGKAGEVLKTLNENKANILYNFPDLGAFVVELPAAALSGITKNPFVIDIEEDAERYPIEAMASEVTAQAFNSIDSNNQNVPYGIDMVQARDVWDANRDSTIDAGALTDPRKTDFFIEYRGLDDRMHQYTPVFLIKLRNGKCLIMEIKCEKERQDAIDDQAGAKALATWAWTDLNPDWLKYQMIFVKRDEIGMDEVRPVDTFLEETCCRPGSTG